MPLLSIHYHPWINEYQCRVSSVPAICAPMTLTELLAASLFADANLLFPAAHHRRSSPSPDHPSTTAGLATMSSHPRNAPPSSFARRIPPSSAGLSAQDMATRRTSRVDMDFEQALKAGGTVVLEEGRRLDTLGLPSPSSNTSVRTTPTKFPVQPATPNVVPPTPTSTTTARRPQRKKAPDITQALAAATAAGASSNPQSSSSETPTTISPVAPQPLEDQDEYDIRTRRRSLFRSPGTSSSPDLATLVRKAKERGGVVGSPTLTAEPSETSTTSLGSGPSPTHLSPSIPTHPPTAYTNGERQRSRTQSTTSGSSSYSLVDSPSLDERIPGTLKITRTGKADKVLGVNGGPMGSVNPDDQVRSVHFDA